MIEPMSLTIVKEYGCDPFLILLSCLLSLRAKDSVTLPVSRQLFEYVHTPADVIKISSKKLEEIIYPIGFYRQKARQLKSVSAELIDRFNGVVPNDREALLSIKGIGPKTAALVLGQAFGVPAICVDVHVHRISNRLGIVKTKTPEETEEALKRIIPKEQWIEWNELLVMWGQNICTPVSPKCSQCPIFDYCKRVGVTKHR